MRPFRLFTLAVGMVLASGVVVARSPEDGGIPAPVRLTLDQAITLALEQNRDVLIADKDRSKADAQITEARAGAFPTISIVGNYTRNIKKPVLFLPPRTVINPTDATATFEIGSDNSYVGGAQLTQALFNWKVGTALDIASLYEEYTEESYRATRDNVVLAVKRAFYSVLLMKELVEANRQGLDIVRANVDNVRAQYRNGVAAEFDLLRAEVQLANTEPLLISAENNRLLATNSLKNLLALPLETELEVTGAILFEDVSADSLEAARRDAVSRNPFIASLSLQESMLTKNISVERGNFFPVLNLVGAYQFQAQDNTFQFKEYRWARIFNLGLSLSLPLFDGFKTTARVEQAMIDRDKIHYARLKAEEGLRIQIQSAELRMAEAKKRISAQRRSVEQAERAVAIAQTRYRSGVGTQLELLDAQVAMTRSRTTSAQAMYDFLIAKAEWSNAVGASL